VLYIPKKSETVRRVLHAAGIAGGHAAAGLFNLLSEWGTVGVILAAELAAEQPSTERCFSMISPLPNSCVIGPFSRTLLSPHQRVKHCISCQFNTIQEIDESDGEDESAQ
jgi:hypothetical protein